MRQGPTGKMDWKVADKEGREDRVTVVEVVRKKKATKAIKTKVIVGNEEQEKGKVRRKKQRKMVKRQNRNLVQGNKSQLTDDTSFFLGQKKKKEKVMRYRTNHKYVGILELMLALRNKDFFLLTTQAMGWR